MDSNVVISFTMGEDFNCLSFSLATNNAVINRNFVDETRTFALPFTKTYDKARTVKAVGSMEKTT